MYSTIEEEPAQQAHRFCRVWRRHRSFVHLESLGVRHLQRCGETTARHEQMIAWNHQLQRVKQGRHPLQAAKLKVNSTRASSDNQTTHTSIQKNFNA